MSDTPPPPSIRTMGECLVLLTACGHRLDEAMGVEEYRVIQGRLIVNGLLGEDGEPTPLGSSIAKDFIARRRAVQAITRTNEVAESATASTEAARVAESIKASVRKSE